MSNIPMLDLISFCLTNLLLPGMGVLFIGFLISLVCQHVRSIKDERLRQLLLELVKAAEQIYGPKKGSAKRRYVLQEAHRRGYPNVARQQVEAAVYDLYVSDFTKKTA